MSESTWQDARPTQPGRRRPSPLVWLVIAIGATIVCAGLLLTVGVAPRTEANVLPRQLAHRAADALARGARPATVLSPATDLRAGGDAFTIIFDSAGRPTMSSATLDGAVPLPPPGVFAYARSHGEDAVTWQPAAGLREAAVVVPIRGGAGYVLSAQPLGDISARELAINAAIFVAWAVVVAAAALGALTTTSSKR